MNFAFISTALDCMGIAHRLKNEGHKVFIWNKTKTDVGSGFNFEFDFGDQKSFLSRHKKDIILWEDSSQGTLQDRLRANGFKVIGSSGLGDKWEKFRSEGLKAAKEYGILVPEFHEINGIKQAIDFIKKYKGGKLILKQSADSPKSLNHKSEFEDNHDMIDHIYNADAKNPGLIKNMVLQEYVEGTEAAVAGWFNGKEWIGYTGVNFENKKLLEGNKGISVGEMGTGFEFSEGRNKMFELMLEPLTEALRKINHIGCVDANCIWTGEKLYLLEHTMRFGYPIQDGYVELLDMDECEFFCNIANGKDDFKIDTENKGVVLALAFPTFPYEKAKENVDNYKDEAVYLDNLKDDEFEHIHFGQIRKGSIKNSTEQLRIANTFGWFGTISNKAKTYEEANSKAYKILENIIPSKAGFSRSDLGTQIEKRYKKVTEIIKEQK